MRLHERPALRASRALGAGLLVLAAAGCSRHVPYAVPVLNNTKLPVIVGLCADSACTKLTDQVILGPGDGYVQKADGSTGAVTWLGVWKPYGSRTGCLRSVANGKTTGALVRVSRQGACPGG